MKENTKTNKVNETLKLPLGAQFEADLESLVYAEDAQSGDPIIIVLLDMDNFDHINKDFGIEVGDRILITLGEHLVKSAPGCAKVYRISGDEFGLIFHGDMEKEDVFLTMENIRRTLECTTPSGEAMTISTGIAEAFIDAARVPELIRMAESAMFRAKLNGHNRVAIAREEKMLPKTSHYTSDQLKRLTKLSKAEGVGEAILLREALDMLLKKYDTI